MIIKAIILTTLLNSDPAIVSMPIPPEKIEARKRRGKGKRDRKRGGSGIR